MNRTIFCILLVLSTLAADAGAAQFVPSKITEVTLFSNRAMVNRESSADIEPGLNEILVEITAFAVDKNSVTAHIVGKGEIVGVQIKDIPLTEFPQQKIQSLEKEIRRLERSRRKLTDKSEVLTKKESFVDAIIEFSQTQIPKDVQTNYPNINDIRETLAFLGSTSEIINNERQALDDDIEKIDKEIERLQKELAAFRVPSQKTKRVIEVLYNAERVENIRLEVQYLVKNAAWNPAYKVAVPLELSDMDLTMFSRIIQKSGEDWKKVRLSVSNVIPLRGVGLPDLSSWVLDVPRPQPVLMKKSRQMETGAVYSVKPEVADEIAAAPAEESATYMQTIQKELPLSFEYLIPFPVDIESRQKSTMMPLFTKKISGTFFHYCVPKKSSLTYLVSEAKADKELLRGKMNVYFGGRYIGETLLAEKKPGEPFFLNLGADREVKVKREKLTDKVKESYFGKIQRDTVVRQFQYKVTAENLKRESVILKIVDSVPVTRTDKIQVKDIKISPSPKVNDYKDQKGVMLWEFQMEPEAKREVSIDYIVTYPAKTPPFGL